MRRLRHFPDIFQHHFHLGQIAARPKLGGCQCQCDIRLARHPDWFAVQERTGTTTSREFLLQHWIVHNPDLSRLINEQCHGDARMRKTVNEIHGSVHRIDDPGGCIGKLGCGARFAALLLADESVLLNQYVVQANTMRFDLHFIVYIINSSPVLGKPARQIVHQQPLHFLVGLRQQINVARLGHDRFTLIIAAGNYLFGCQCVSQHF